MSITWPRPLFPSKGLEKSSYFQTIQFCHELMCSCETCPGSKIMKRNPHTSEALGLFFCCKHRNKTRNILRHFCKKSTTFIGTRLDDYFLKLLYYRKTETAFSETRLNFPHKLSMRSWTLAGDAWLTPDSVTWIIFAVRLHLLFCWSPSRTTLLRSVQFVLPPLGWLVHPLEWSASF